MGGISTVIRFRTSESSDGSSVYLPRRKRQVDVKIGSTRHGHTVGRAIDLALCSRNLGATLVIHNGVQCCSDAPCPWPDCVGFALCDHFFGQISVDFGIEARAEPSLPRFPAAWCDIARWQSGLKRFGPALNSFCSHLKLLESVTSSLRKASQMM